MSGNNYIVCGMPRSGSSLLCRWLYLTEQAGYPLEHIKGSYEYSFIQSAAFDHIPNAEQYLQKLVQHRTPNGIFGTKMHWFQFQHITDTLARLPHNAGLNQLEIINKYLENPKHIYIVRKDKVRQAISYFRAFESGQWAYNQTAKTEAKDIEFNSEMVDCLLYLIVEHEAAWERYFADHNIEPFRVVYEDFVGQQQETVTELFDYLEIPLQELETPKMKKQADSKSDSWYEEYLLERVQILPQQAREPMNGAEISKIGNKLEVVDAYAALSYYSDLIQQSPGRLPVYHFRARVYQKIGEYDKALQDVEHLIKNMPGADRWQVWKTRLLSLKGNGKHAVQQLDLENISDVDAPWIQLEYAQLLADMGRQSEAFALIEALLKKSPKMVYGLLVYAELLLNNGDYQTTLATIAKATNLIPQPWAKMFYLRGVASHHLGNQEQAQDDIHQFLERVGVTHLTQDEVDNCNLVLGKLTKV